MNLPISNPAIRVIGLVSLLCLVLLYPAGSSNHKSSANAPVQPVTISVQSGAFADSSFDDYRDVRTSNSFAGEIRTLEELGITQASQLIFFIGGQGNPLNTPVYLVATVTSDRNANTREVRLTFIQIQSSQGFIPCQRYVCPGNGDPCAFPLCPDRYYPGKVAFISTPQPFGPPANPPDFLNSIQLLPQDIDELQRLIDIYGAANIRIGSTTEFRTGHRFCLENASGPTLETMVSNINPLECTVPGSVVTVTVKVTNPSNTLQAKATTFSDPPSELLPLPGSCSSNIGTCTVTDRRIFYEGTLARNQTARNRYQGRVANGTTPGTVLCIETSPSGITGSCRTSTACITVSCPATICLQDDHSGDVLRFNPLTGEYLFTKCGADGFSLSGRGGVSRQGCSIELHSPQVSAAIDKCPIIPQNRGRATILRTPLGPTFIINDNDITNNTCACP